MAAYVAAEIELMLGFLVRQDSGAFVRLIGRFRVGIGLLPGDAPVAQFIDGDSGAGDGADDMRSGQHNLEIAIEIANLGFPVAAAFKPVHRPSTPHHFARLSEAQSRHAPKGTQSRHQAIRIQASSVEMNALARHRPDFQRN